MSEVIQVDLMEKVTFELAFEEWREGGQADMIKENSKLRLEKTWVYHFKTYLGKGKTSPGDSNIVHMQENRRKQACYVK